VKDESFSGYSVEFSQSSFGKTPKVFNAIHMRTFSVGIFFGMIGSFALVAVKNKTTIYTDKWTSYDGIVLSD